MRDFAEHLRNIAQIVILHIRIVGELGARCEGIETEIKGISRPVCTVTEGRELKSN